MAKILVSACLLGFKVRYNGSCIDIENKTFKDFVSHHKITSFCPEVSSGLSIPRDPSEIIGGNGYDVLSGSAKVITKKGDDVTAFFLSGAENALYKCRKEGISLAVLSERSPSCGSSLIYDGSFTGLKKEGLGVTAALLEKSGIKVFSQYNISCLINYLNGSDF